MVTTVDDKHVPVILAPTQGETSVDALASWFTSSEEFVTSLLGWPGAALFRGFDVGSPEAFRKVARAAVGKLGNYVGGDAPRSAVAEQVYDATSFPPPHDLPLHNELSYAGAWPSRLAFCAITPALWGGQTTVASGRDIYASMNDRVRRRFAALGVTYLQHLRDEGTAGAGKSWQETFETRSRAAVERMCVSQGVDFEWTTLGLHTSRTNPAIRSDVWSGCTYWFNQADLWHAEFDVLKDRAERSSRIDLLRQLGSHALFGDGSEIPIEHLEEVRRVYRRCEVPIDWRGGDILVINNLNMLHGRRAYSGDRRILVAMDQLGTE
jgi:hypothetical protein